MNKLLRFFVRPPDWIIGEVDNPYLHRWWVIPKNRFFNIYLHKFLRSDDDRALHDHPWWSIGMILKGEYFEHMPKRPDAYRDGLCREEIRVRRRAWKPVLRRAEHIHRVELYVVERWYDPKRKEIMARPVPVWTLFITGPKLREWGFWCPQGFRHWEQFVSKFEGGNSTGIGCE